jgi:uncharacterized protein
VEVHKLDALGREVWTYPGRLLSDSADSRTLEATFDRKDGDLGELQLRRGDRFVETFYSDRWYSVFAIHDVYSGRLKAWYCNLSRPARFEVGHIFAEDLALDLVIFPDGRETLLDEDEYAALNLDEVERGKVGEGLEELREMAREGLPPFEARPH